MVWPWSVGERGRGWFPPNAFRNPRVEAAARALCAALPHVLLRQQECGDRLFASRRRLRRTRADGKICPQTDRLARIGETRQRWCIGPAPLAPLERLRPRCVAAANHHMVSRRRGPGARRPPRRQSRAPPRSSSGRTHRTRSASVGRAARRRHPGGGTRPCLDRDGGATLRREAVVDRQPADIFRRHAGFRATADRGATEGISAKFGP